MHGGQPAGAEEPASARILGGWLGLHLRQQRADGGRRIGRDLARDVVGNERVQFCRRQLLDVDTESQLVAAPAVIVLCAEDAPAPRDAQCPAALADAIERTGQQRRDVRVGGKLEGLCQTGAQGVLFDPHGARQQPRGREHRLPAGAATPHARKPGTRSAARRPEPTPGGWRRAARSRALRCSSGA